MQTRSQRAWMAVAVAGISVMGFAGWWVGGMGTAKVAAPVADAAVTAEVPPVPSASPAAATAYTLTADQLVVNGNANQETSHSFDRQNQAGQLTIHSDAATGNLIITGDNGQQVIQSGVLRLNRPDRATADGKAAGGGPTVVRDGTLTRGVANVDANGNVTTFTITSDGGMTKMTTSNGGTLRVGGNVVINGNLVIRDGQGQGPTRVVEPVVPAANPGLP